MNQMPAVTKNLLIINILCFAACVVLEKYNLEFTQLFGLHFALSEQFQLWQPLTYMFMHAGFAHLFFNMFALWMFGRTLEMVWGPKRFLIYYLVCGLGAALAQELVQFIQYFALLPNLQSGDLSAAYSYQVLMQIPTIGASGAVYGILLAFGMLFPNERMFIFPLPMPIKAKWFVMAYAAIELFQGLGASSADNVAHFAHLGGMFFGFFLILYWKRNGNNGRTFFKY